MNLQPSVMEKDSIQPSGRLVKYLTSFDLT